MEFLTSEVVTVFLCKHVCNITWAMYTLHFGHETIVSVATMFTFLDEKCNTRVIQKYSTIIGSTQYALPE